MEYSDKGWWVRTVLFILMQRETAEQWHAANRNGKWTAFGGILLALISL
jgi:hypothetical protein